jgi:hypothetical protein
VFEVNTDYKQVKKEHELVSLCLIPEKNNELRGGSNKKYYIITAKTFIMLLMRARTIKSLRYAEHFYCIYDLMIKYYKYQSETMMIDYKENLKKLCELPHIKEYSRLQSIKYLELELQETNRIGLVYFIHEENNFNVYKVGFTTDLKIRLECLQVSNPRKLFVYKKIFSAYPSTLENIIHKYLNDKLIRGEWYAIDKEMVNKICEEYK